MELTIEGQKRVEGSKPNSLRRQGLIPAVVYGHNGSESLNLTLKAKPTELLIRDASLNNTLIQLNIPDIPWSGKTLLREIQTHPAKGTVYHLSFFAVSAQESLEVEVPLHFVGEPIGVKLEGGMLDLVLNELQVKCKPNAIPANIEVDVSQLHLGQSLHVRELNLPSDVVALGEPERVVVSVLNSSGDPDSKESASA